MTEFMRNSDAFSWAMEHDPRLRSTVVTIFTLDKVPDWDEVTARFREIAATLPMFRRRVIENLPPAPPRWEDDPEFDFDYHVRRVTAPAPGTLETVLEMARRAEMDDFDRARPLWEVTMVDGLQRGEAAMVVKLHHALTDGVGGVQIAMTLFDLEAEPPARGPLAPDPVVVPASGNPLSRVLAYDARQLGGLALDAVRGAPSLVLNGLRRPVGTVRSAADLARWMVDQSGEPRAARAGEPDPLGHPHIVAAGAAAC